MKQTFIIIYLLLFAYACNNKQIITEESPIDSSSVKPIKIPKNYNNILQIDSIFDKIEAVALETQEKYLIKYSQKIKIKGDYLYILDNYKNLFVFSTSTGKFIRQIGKQGKGPGEYLNVRDFDFDNKGNIYIMDFRQILKYTVSGKFIEKYTLDFAKSNITANPSNIAVADEDHFYIWAGSYDIKENKNKNLFLMYKIDKKGNIINRYFPLKYYLMHSPNRFRKYDNTYNIQPWYGNNIIYSIDNGSVKSKYYIDFGDLTFKDAVPESLKSFGGFKEKIDQKYANSIRGFIEMDDWIYFMFQYKRKVQNVYYSKKTKKVFVSNFYPRNGKKIQPDIINAYQDKKFISLLYNTHFVLI